MTFGELKELLPFIDVDSIDDDELILVEKGYHWSIPYWLQREIIKAQKQARELHEHTMEGFHQVVALNTTHKTDGPASEQALEDFKH